MKRFVHIIMVLVVINIHAQISQEYVIASIGGYTSNSFGSASYTVGEMSMVQTFYNGSNYLTQGFLQATLPSIGLGNTPLPVTLVDFSGFYTDGADHLVWTTASELDNDHFNVQRMNAAGEFQNIGAVKGMGTSTKEHNYSFDDKTPLAGVNYYRLQQVDVDGNFTYSDIIAITTPGSNAITVAIYPNPAKSNLTVSFTSQENCTGTLSITDMVGTIIYKGEVELNSGTTLTNLDLSGYEQGTYIVKLNTNISNTTCKVTKQL